MRLSIRHETLHHYAQPAKSVIQSLRLTPRNHEGQHVVHWRIDVDVECRLKASQDAFGNIVHGFSSDGPLAMVAVTATGEVDTFDTRGVINGAVERFPPELYLRSTPLTPASAAVRATAETAIAGEEGELNRLHALLRTEPSALLRTKPSALLRTEPSALLRTKPSMDSEKARPTHDVARQSQATERAEAPPDDLAHLFITCARLIEIPARYVAGYRLTETTVTPNAMHGWAEAFVPRLGWVGFDPVHELCPDERYVRVAIGLDSLGASAMRGAQMGGTEPVTEVKLAVAESRSRGQG
jgi:transglutaminase-like putative cysteine protease